MVVPVTTGRGDIAIRKDLTVRPGWELGEESEVHDLLWLPAISPEREAEGTVSMDAQFDISTGRRRARPRIAVGTVP